jgi:FixJ family two-component response regulator
MTGAKVLLLDDDEEMLAAMGELVRLISGRPCLALRSLAQLQARRDEVLACERAILDVNLGPAQPSGLDAYEWLRAQGFRGKIAFLTGHALRHPLVARASALAGVTVLQKPVNIDDVRGLLDLPPKERSR